VRLAFWGLLATWVYGSLFVLGMSVSMMWMRILEHWSDGACRFDPSLPPWGCSLVVVVACTAVPLLVGWEVARDSAGRELPAAFAVASLFAAFYVLRLYLSAIEVHRIGHPTPGMENAFTMLCAQALSVMAGAILFRCRTLARRKSAC
jgi:hypothetical protein